MSQEIIIKDTTSNPAPLGLLGFGLSTCLLNLHNIGLFPVDAMIIGMAIFMGGLAQVLVGYLEWKKNNIFGTTVFSAYGFFWLVLAVIFCSKNLGLTPSSNIAMGWFCTLWGIFSFFMFIASLVAGRVLQITMAGVFTLFFLLAAENFILASGNIALGHQMKFAAGCCGIITGGLALYSCFAQVINAMYGRVILTLGDRK